MPCYHPIDAWRKNGGGVTFDLKDGFKARPITIACGQCIGCRLERSRQWAVRCMHEASLHSANCFLTLTYDDDHLPRSIDTETGEIGAGRYASLNKIDIQNFIKRLRKRTGVKIRYLQCGEYGDRTGRPHHHVIFFGYDFPDKYHWGQRDGYNYWRSPMLDESSFDSVGRVVEPLWPHGHSIIGDLTFESAAYVARYCLKKVTGEDADAIYVGRLPEFITMSLKPGIAHDWISNNLDDVYPNDRVFVKSGVVSRPPKYYDKIYDVERKDFWKIRRNRVLKAKQRPRDSVRRLVDREICMQLKAAQLKRSVD